MRRGGGEGKRAGVVQRTRREKREVSSCFSYPMAAQRDRQSQRMTAALSTCGLCVSAPTEVRDMVLALWRLLYEAAAPHLAVWPRPKSLCKLSTSNCWLVKILGRDVEEGAGRQGVGGGGGDGEVCRRRRDGSGRIWQMT